MSKTLRRCAECGKLFIGEMGYDVYWLAKQTYFCTIEHGQKWVDKLVRK